MEAIFIIFPRLDQLPNARLQWMITCLAERNQEGPLPRFRELNQMFQVLDATGQRVCLFKLFRANEEISARKEAAVYLLDHPEDGPRSQSQTLSGFSTVFVRFRNEGRNLIDILIEFVEAFQGPFDVNRVPIEELHKVCLVDLRFAVTDRQRQNVLTRLDDNGVLRYVPIDHGYSFFDQAPRFTILGLAWLNKQNRGFGPAANIPFSIRFATYVVAQLDSEADLAFLDRCGWVIGNEYRECFMIFTKLLKTGVSLGFTPLQLGRIATARLRDEHMMYNLAERVPENEQQFVERVSACSYRGASNYRGLL